MLSLFITIGSVVGRIYNKAIEDSQSKSETSDHSKQNLWLIPVGICGVIMVCCLGAFATYRCLRRPSPSSGHQYQLLRR